MGLSHYLSGKILEASVAKAPLDLGGPPLYLALLLAEPGPEVTGGELVEPTYPAYARPEVDADAWGVADRGMLTNTAPIPLPASSGGPWRIVAWALVDAPTGGNVHWVGRMPAIVLAPDDLNPQVNAGALSVFLS